MMAFLWCLNPLNLLSYSLVLVCFTHWSFLWWEITKELITKVLKLRDYVPVRRNRTQELIAEYGAEWSYVWSEQSFQLSRATCGRCTSMAASAMSCMREAEMEESYIRMHEADVWEADVQSGASNSSLLPSSFFSSFLSYLLFFSLLCFTPLHWLELVHVLVPTTRSQPIYWNHPVQTDLPGPPSIDQFL